VSVRRDFANYPQSVPVLNEFSQDIDKFWVTGFFQLADLQCIVLVSDKDRLYKN